MSHPPAHLASHARLPSSELRAAPATVDVQLVPDPAPWLRVGPGPAGLLNSLLRYLASNAETAGPRRPGSDLRTLAEIHNGAGAAHGLSIAHTRSALFELEAYHLVESDPQPRWRATHRGIDALNETPRDGAAGDAW